MKELFVRIVRNVQMLWIPILAVALVAAGIELPHKKDVQLTARSQPMVLIATIDTSSSTVGIADSGLYFMTAEQLTVAMEQLQSLGITQIRVFLPWRAIETADNTYDWMQADLVLDTAAAYGLAVVAGVTSTPTWASDYGGLVANGEPSTSSAYADFVGALAERYGTAANDGEAKISAYEVWNEPNGFTGWYPEPDAAQYTELLKAAYTAIKAVDLDATVVAGALGTGISIGTLTINPVDFLAQMYEAGAAGYFDALSFHPYNYTSMFSEGTTFANSAIKQLAELREIMDANGDSDLLIWVTEYGQPSSQVSEANQAAYIADFLSTWSELTGVGPAFLYSLVDSATGSSIVEDNLGLFTDGWTAKAVVEVVKAWITGQPVTVDPGESTSGGTIPDMLAALVKAAQSFVTSIASMVTASFSGFTQLVQGIVDAVVGLISSITGGATAAAQTALTATAVGDAVDGVRTADADTATARQTTARQTESGESDTPIVDTADPDAAAVAVQDVLETESVPPAGDTDTVGSAAEPATEIDATVATVEEPQADQEVIVETMTADLVETMTADLPIADRPWDRAPGPRRTNASEDVGPQRPSDRFSRPSAGQDARPGHERPATRETIRRPRADQE
ncbi:cellulase family glycosylhydrolase [Mycobacterium sp. C31M]